MPLSAHPTKNGAVRTVTTTESLRRRLRGPNFEKNVGGTERLLRLGVGATLVALSLALVVGLAATSVDPFARLGGAAVALLAGSRLVWTGYTQKCYLNRRLGRNSCRR